MREPGGLLLRLADALGLTRLRDTVLLPAVADMQHECGEAGSGARHTWALLRGYWGIVSGCAFYATQLPWRHLRENWVGVEAPGPRLLRMAAPVAALVTGLTSGAALAAWPNERGFGFGHLALLLPGMAVSVAALALATGVGWTLARNPSMSRAAVGVGVLGAGLSFAFFEVVVTTANQEFRVVGFQALTGRGNELRKGSREMTLRELGDVAALANVSACPPKPAGRHAEAVPVPHFSAPSGITVCPCRPSFSLS